MLVFIYKITCRIDGRCYVGQTRFDVHTRLAQHVKADSLVGRAIRQFGIDNFDLEILDVVNDRDATAVEADYIDRFNCRVPYGFNVASPVSPRGR